MARAVKVASDGSAKGPVRCAVIGTGRIGSSLETDRFREKPASHAGAVSRDPNAVLVAGADIDPDRLAAFGRLWRLPDSALFDDADSMLSAAAPELVSIAADTEAHVPLLMLCLEREVPVIVLEKPVGADITEARGALAAVEAAERAGTSRVLVNHERRFARDWRRAREILRTRELGELRSVHARLYMGLRKTPARVLWHDGTHLADILSFLLGPWSVQAVHGDPDDATGNLLAVGRTGAIGADGAVGTAGADAGQNRASIVLDVSPGRDYLAFEIDFDCSSGRLRCGNGVWELWKSEPSRLYEEFRSLALKSRPGKTPYRTTGYFSGMMAHAVALARDPLLPVESSFRDGLSALETLDAIIRMGRDGRNEPSRTAGEKAQKSPDTL